MRIAYTKLALERILEIAEFRFPDAPERAKAWMGALIEHVGQLEVFPHLGRRISSGRDASGEIQNVRRLLFKDVWIIYEVQEESTGSEETSEEASSEGNPAGSRILILTVRHVREKPEDES